MLESKISPKISGWHKLLQTARMNYKHSPKVKNLVYVVPENHLELLSRFPLSVPEVHQGTSEDLQEENQAAIQAYKYPDLPTFKLHFLFKFILLW